MIFDTADRFLPFLYNSRQYRYTTKRIGKENQIMFEKYPDIVTIEQLQEMLNLGRNNAYKLLQANKIKHRKWGRKYLIPKMYVIEFATEIFKEAK